MFNIYFTNHEIRHKIINTNLRFIELQVLKVDVTDTNQTKEWFRPGFSPSEPVFISKPTSTTEDDGIIMFSALDQTDTKKALLVILNACSFEEEAVIEFQCSGTVTKDFHGITRVHDIFLMHFKKF